MRPHASVLHLDLDAFFASVEQRDKPSLRGKPVIVGGVGGRGVVATASYEARVFGVHSAMSTALARRRAPHAAYLSGRRAAYRESSRAVMALLHELSPRVEQLSIDEAYVDLVEADVDVTDEAAVLARAVQLRADLTERTEGLTASVGIGSSKFMAKVASELAKPNGLRLVSPGSEVMTIAGLPARAVPGVGPVTMEKLHRLGVETVADLQALSLNELNREVGRSWGESLHLLAFAQDERPVESSRETKSISVEETFERDVRDREILLARLAVQVDQVTGRMQRARLFARTITLKVRLADFSTLTRSRTLHGATDTVESILAVGTSLLAGVDLREGVRLLGIGVSSFTEAGQEALFEVADVDDVEETTARPAVETGEPGPVWRPGHDVEHDQWGRGWVQGSGLGRVTVRFESRHTEVGRVRTFSVDDPALRGSEPEPLAWRPAASDGDDAEPV